MPVNRHRHPLLARAMSRYVRYSSLFEERRNPLRDNDVETITRREFTLEGRGRNIRWLCPLSLMERLLRQPALKLRKAVGRRLFQRRLPRRLNSSSVLVAARLRPRTNCASLAKRIARQAFLEGSGRSCAVRGSISSALTDWRRQRDAGAFEALSPVNRGPKVAAPNPLAAEHAQLKRDNRLLTKRLERAEAIIEIQKNELGSSGRLWR